ncbi:MAG TPA: hypothetical protein VFK05_17900 [Polyangiaceae bacterium]|nr:hypothetical protein [Polyangiaceae bacterium]
MRSVLFLLLGSALLSVAPSAAWADDKPPAPEKRPDAKPGKHDHDHDHGGPPGGPRGHGGMPGMPGMHDMGHGPMHDGGAPGMHEGGPPGPGMHKNSVVELFREAKAGKITKEELKQKLRELHDSAPERKKEQRQELGKRWGTTLAKPVAREELRVHARRIAFLNRALELAQSDTKPDKDKTIERITKLIDKENARHDQAMTRIQSQPAPAASAAPTPAPAPAASEANGGSK